MGAASAQQFNGLSIFTRKHYSMMVASGNRPDLTDINNATADQLRAVFIPMAANSGTYDIAGDVVTIRACRPRLVRTLVSSSTWRA